MGAILIYNTYYIMIIMIILLIMIMMILLLLIIITTIAIPMVMNMIIQTNIQLPGEVCAHHVRGI